MLENYPGGESVNIADLMSSVGPIPGGSGLEAESRAGAFAKACSLVAKACSLG
jgi:hypothetical protein